MFKNIALLIDAENVAPSFWPEIQKNCKRFDDVRIGKIFADFSGSQYLAWQKIAREHGLQAVHQPSNGKGKNSADIAFTIAAMDLLHDGHFDAFALVSNDRDFSPLAQRLRQSGTRVLGMGSSKSPHSLRNSFDVFLLLKSASKSAAQSVMVNSSEVELLRKIITRLCADEGGTVTPSALGTALRDQHQKLAEKLVGKGKLLRTIRSHKIADETGRGGSLRLSPRGEKTAA